MKKVLAILLLAFASLAPAQQAQTLFEQEAQRIYSQREAGKLSILETAIELEAAAKAYFPTDGLLLAYHASVRAYAEQHQSGALTRERFIELQEQRLDRFVAALAERDKAEAAQRVAQEKAATTAATEAARSNAIGNFLRSMATATNRVTPRPAVNCTSYALGASVSTACQ
ncbi:MULTISPECIES: hypothetical protein [unclassified Polaromonas]|jgi:ribosomal protein L12E/L44/L45/RPP1/RPP2|uniref:hypothetical protein n=1 Tax=unclassified Polaromonas TaxID=2638319 RepID=UPI000BD262F1|nr:MULTISPECIES: hypothetical protein [unclassified Polaromonas]OYZ79721.1 MAG: hypothetical protein B7Y09_09370 [Polaromonas sp. 24-63-21]OZA47301.1 MAG: hypothetical protein B7X88_22640 [Polaromonas sp. 17-63-33]HQS00768.1 hypothetical protein [Polaromonas sp.]HQS38949.1 hypothetical protein [Polaromonas sp.]HQT09680.1 hypothetical protein [Polaromonas sp.]